MKKKKSKKSKEGHLNEWPADISVVEGICPRCKLSVYRKELHVIGKFCLYCEPVRFSLDLFY